MQEKQGRLSVLLAAAGLLISIVLTFLHVQAYLDPGTASFCAVNAEFDCDAVALSPYSVFLGIPLAAWGVVGFIVLFLAAGKRSPTLFPLALFATLASVAMLVVELQLIGSVCLFCEVVHLLCLGLLVTSWRDGQVKHLRSYLQNRRQVAIDFGIPAVLLVLIHLFTPPYWVLASWASGPQLPRGVTEDGRPWIGAEQPVVTVYEYVDYSCPHCALAASRMRIRVAEHADQIRLVRHQHPRMRCVPAYGTKCLFVRAAICAGDQGKFWEMDDWLFGHIPGVLRFDPDRVSREVGLDVDELQRCIADESTYKRADIEVKTALKKKIRETPMYEIDGKRLTPVEMVDELKRRL